MLLPCNPPVSAENFHPRAQIHPDTKLPLPSDVSIVFKCWLLVSDAHTKRIKSQCSPSRAPKKPITQVSSLLDISHHQSPGGDRPEKRVVHACVHTRPSVTRFHTNAQGESRFYHRLTEASTGSAPFEYE